MHIASKPIQITIIFSGGIFCWCKWPETTKIRHYHQAGWRNFWQKMWMLMGPKCLYRCIYKFYRRLFENIKGSVQYSTSLNFCGRAKTLVLLNHRHVPWGRRSCRIDFDPLTFTFFGRIRIVQLVDNVLILLFLVTYNNKKSPEEQ